MEPIEQWQKEFEDWFFEKNEVKHNDFTKILWSSWLAAKRSQPVVELPKIGMCFGKAPFSYFLADQTVESLTAAGIQYRIKGE